MANFSLKQRLAPGGKVTVVLLKHSLSARTVRHQSGHRCPVSVIARIPTAINQWKSKCSHDNFNLQAKKHLEAAGLRGCILQLNRECEVKQATEVTAVSASNNSFFCFVT